MNLIQRNFAFLLVVLTSMLAAPGFSQDRLQVESKDTYKGSYTIKDGRFNIWNGSAYIPLFVKGINLGISLPGTQPGNLAAGREDYRRWFDLIKEAGYNSIRLYTLHFPRFYEELARYNQDHPQNPLLVIQGIWLEENEGARDLFEMSGIFSNEIREVVSAVHGDLELGHRFGKAYGSFSTDISPWVLGFLAGREIFPGEVALTNQNHMDVNNYTGTYFTLAEADPVEAWLTERLDSLMIYEQLNYQSVRPTGFSSWPTLDPITHPTEEFNIGSTEDLEKIDLANMEESEASGGFFIGYHAYPYYPDFIIQDPATDLKPIQLAPTATWAISKI